MTNAISGVVFCEMLKSMGMQIPDNTFKITLKVKGWCEPICFVYHMLKPGNNTVYKQACYLMNEKGERVHSTELYFKLKDVMSLPDETSSFKIECDLHDLVHIKVKSVLMDSAVEALGDYKFVNKQ